MTAGSVATVTVEDGERTGKEITLEAIVPGFTTVTDAVPGLATAVAGTFALRALLERNVVFSDCPFHRTTAPDRKPVP